MSQFQRDFSRSFKSTSDLSSGTGRNHFSAIDASNANSVVVASSSTDLINGVLQGNPKAGAPVDVQWLGSSRVVAGGTITRGAYVTSDSTGRAVAWSTGVKAGRALESAVSGDVVEIQLMLS